MERLYEKPDCDLCEEINSNPRCDRCIPPIPSGLVKYVDVYMEVEGQHIMSEIGPIALNMLALEMAMDIHRITNRDACRLLVKHVYKHFYLETIPDLPGQE